MRIWHGRRELPETHSSTGIAEPQSASVPEHPLIKQLLIAWCLMASNVAIHATGVITALRWLRVYERGKRVSWNWVFVAVAGWVILLHVTEIMAWALVYLWRGAMPDLPSALYFSAVTYTTTGYGDLVLPQSWRLVGAVEAMTGILMFGWSTGFFVAVLSRALQDRRSETT